MYFVPFLCVLFAFAGVQPLFAEEWGGAVFLIGSYSLWVSAAIGLLASILTLNYSFVMAGSTVADILRPIGIGMLAFVVGALSLIIAWSDFTYQKILHDALFILGSVSILVGVLRMRRLTA